MSSRGEHREVPLQDYTKIKLMYLPNALSNGKLYVDLAFPPDHSSLTYVYSGDDRYEKMVFKRPKEICPNAVLAGTGGVYETTFPWQTWKKNGWFEAAVAIVSLSVCHMEKLVVGYRNMEQSMQGEYIGAFHFNLWRFGDWIDVVVDDHVPTLNNRLLYCPASGSPPEFWGPLVEKAYAKCKKTYEAIECGSVLDVLTDLTGSVCEFYTPDINPPENLFHILYKSCVNRSLIVCWRNDKRLTPTGYKHTPVLPQEPNTTEDDNDCERYLHIITATTKFPVTDGRMIEMLRLKCPFQSEPKWNGKFAKGDEMSWCTVNSDFLAKYKPLYNKDEDEYWISLEDFRCNFGGLLISSSGVPYSPEGLNAERFYRRATDDEKQLANNGDLRTGSDVTFHLKPKRSVPDRYTIPRPYVPGEGYISHKDPRYKKAKQRTKIFRELDNNLSSNEIIVKENTTTVKVDNTEERSTETTFQSNRKKTDAFSDNLGCQTPPRYRYKLNDKRRADYRKEFCKKYDRCQSSPSGRKCRSDKSESDLEKGRSGSIISSQSTFSTSDITVDFQGCSRDNSLKRPYSAKNMKKSTRKFSSGSLPNMTVHNFLATCSDHFQSHGSWRELLEYRGKWKKIQLCVARGDLKVHSRNHRIMLPIVHPDAVNELLTPSLHGKAHVLISLLQDYRHGASTANSLLVPIGFSIYRCKNPTKDEKRSLSKLQLVGEVGPTEDVREVNGRFDLEPGNYFIVPYCLSESHEGLYLVRILSEKDPVAGKTGCTIS